MSEQETKEEVIDVKEAAAKMIENLSSEEEEVKEEEVKEETKEEKKEVESPEKYYEKLAQQDQEIQQLKSRLKKSSGGLESLKAKVAENPKAILDELGISPDQLLDIWSESYETDEVVATPEETPNVNPEIDVLKKKIEQLEQQQYSKQTAEYQSAERQRLQNIVEKEGKWPLVKALAKEGSYDAVLNYAINKYSSNIKEGMDEEEAVPDYMEVLSEVEGIYKKNIESTISFAKELDLFKTFFNIKEEKERKTLSSALNDTASPHELSDEEIRRNAAALVAKLEKEGTED
jgi:hypothetical protein